MATSATHTQATQDDEPSTGIVLLTLALFAAAIYAAVAVLALPLVAAVGFSIAIPSAIVTAINALRAR